MARSVKCCDKLCASIFTQELHNPNTHSASGTMNRDFDWCSTLLAHVHHLKIVVFVRRFVA
jgi:hypothetical protein